MEGKGARDAKEDEKEEDDDDDDCDGCDCDGCDARVEAWFGFGWTDGIDDDDGERRR